MHNNVLLNAQTQSGGFWLVVKVLIFHQLEKSFWKRFQLFCSSVSFSLLSLKELEWLLKRSSYCPWYEWAFSSGLQIWFAEIHSKKANKHPRSPGTLKHSTCPCLHVPGRQTVVLCNNGVNCSTTLSVDRYANRSESFIKLICSGSSKQVSVLVCHCIID